MCDLVHEPLGTPTNLLIFQADFWLMNRISSEVAYFGKQKGHVQSLLRSVVILRTLGLAGAPMCRLKIDSRYVPVLLAAAAQLKLTILTMALPNVAHVARQCALVT